MEARRLLITGRVQGVGFRHHMSVTARHLGITGWVRNRTDGSVEAVVSGSPEAIAAISHWSRQGPPAARVGQVIVEQLDDLVQTDGFSQRPTE